MFLGSDAPVIPRNNIIFNIHRIPTCLWFVFHSALALIITKKTEDKLKRTEKKKNRKRNSKEKKGKI